MKICDVTGRIHRSKPEQAAELARIDAQLAALRVIREQFTAGYESRVLASTSVTDAGLAVGDAFNAVHDAIDALERERAEVVENPRPIPAAEAGTWALIQDNID